LGGASTSKLMGKIAMIDKALVRLSAKYAVGTLSEIGEEELQLFIEPAIRSIVFGEDYDAPTVEEMLDTAIVTAMSTVAMNVGSDIVSGNTSTVEGLTVNEAKVAEKEASNRIAEREANGEKVSAKDKNKIYDEVIEDLKKGYISTDTIESVLDGKSYESYKNLRDNESRLNEKITSLTEEIETLLDKENPTIRDNERLAEARKELEAAKSDLEKIGGYINEHITYTRHNMNEVLKGERRGKGSYLAESYSEIERKGQRYVADFSKYEGAKHADAARATIENAIGRGANNTNRVHDIVEMAAKLSADTGIVFDWAGNKDVKADFIKRQNKEIRTLMRKGELTEAESKALAELKETLRKVKADEITVGGTITDKGVVINLDSKSALNKLVGHEITHSFEGAKAYPELKNALFAYAKQKGIDIEAEIAAKAKTYTGIKGANAEAELVADLVGRYIFEDYAFVHDLAMNHRNVFQRLYDEIKYLCKLATAGSKEARDLERAKRNFEKAYRESADTKAKTDGVTKYDIAILEGGKAYVEASRKVINGTTRAEQRKEISNFFNELLDENDSLDITTLEGDILTITKADTAHKARDDHKLVDGQRVDMTDDEFAVKLRVEAHIDEVAEVSTKTKQNVADSKGHAFAKDGFTYRRAYFKDFDGQYYEITLSIGHNGTVATVYNVGKIKESALPTAKIIAGVGSKALGKTLSNYSISQNSEKSTDFSKLFSRDSSGRNLSEGQKEYFAESKVLDKSGNLKVMFHGTHESFTVFDKAKARSGGTYGKGFYFTDSESMTAPYGKAYEVYLNIKNPLQNGTNDITKDQLRSFVEAIAENEDYGLENYGYGATVDSVVDSVWGKSDFAMFLDLNATCIGDMVAAVELFNEVNGTEYDGIIAPTETVAFYPNQIKSVDNTTPTADPDMQLSLTENEDLLAPIGRNDVVGEDFRVQEDLAPLPENVKSKVKPKVAQVLTEEPKVPKKKSRIWSTLRTNLLDKQSVFEDLALKTGNRELMGKANYMLSSESRAQWLIGNGSGKVKALTDIRKEVESSGKLAQFQNYMYHVHNIDRMSLETDENRARRLEIRGQFKGLSNKQIEMIAEAQIAKDTPVEDEARIRAAREFLELNKSKDKPVFGYSVTADQSRDTVKRYEAKNPEFKAWAQDVYNYNKHLRQLLVEGNVISQETADLWEKIYPHFVPIRRQGHDGAAVNVPLDSRKTGVNAPIKKATGGDGDILPLFDTMALRTEQTFRAIARNQFGLELMHTLDTTKTADKTGKGVASVDEVLDRMETQDELLQKGKDGMNPTFTVFENGKRVTFEITEDMYDALKPTSKALAHTIKPLNAISNVRRGLITEYNPAFLATNAIKDAQDVLINSQHPAKTYANLPNAFWNLATKGQWYTEYMAAGGEQNTYFDGKSNTFKKEDKGIVKLIGMPLRAISVANNFVERAPRLAEYIASRKDGASVEVAMLDAARVTTNFAAGGDVTKLLNRNGATFLNASVQGAMQQVRNVREAKQNGLKGWVQLAAKTMIAGIPALLLNGLLWDDDEDYEELSDYVKDNYYIVAKYGDGKFVRIPKGRAVAVIQDAFEQIGNTLTGNDDVDLKNFLDLAVSNLAPNNPIDNNLLAPITQAVSNTTWYGDDLVPTRLQDLPAEEQFDESTDAISKWLGEVTNTSPIKWNYVLDQYSGVVGDIVLPMLTPEAESGDKLFGKVLAPMRDKFTADSVFDNQNISDFYDTVDELAKNANSSRATDEDILMSKYINSVNSELADLYKVKREIQNSDLADVEKYEAVREIQEEILDLAKEGLSGYRQVSVDGVYATVGERHFRMNDDGEWVKLTGKQIARQEEVTKALGVTPSNYWKNKAECDFAFENPKKYAVAKAIGGYTLYDSYVSELSNIKADKDKNGKTISGSRKEKVIDWLNERKDMDYGEKLLLFKSVYNADDTYNYDIVEYLNGREDLSYRDVEAILLGLGFSVDAKGNVTWD